MPALITDKYGLRNEISAALSAIPQFLGIFLNPLLGYIGDKIGMRIYQSK
jgi:nitrate/nitrite transporter NarK